MTRWYKNFLLNRRTFVDIKGIKIARKLFYGTPQGGILSPLIWNLIMDDLLVKLRNQDVHIVPYADNLSLFRACYNTRQDRRILWRQMQKALQICLDWGIKMGLNLSPDKSECLLIHSSHRPPPFQPFQLNAATIKTVSLARYLGVWIDSKLKWTQHIKRKIAASRKVILMTRHSLGRTWGPSPKLMRWAYTMCVRPFITYGCFVWAHALTQPLHQKLQSIQRLALMQCGHMRKAMPTETLNVLTNVPPISLYIQKLVCRSYVRMGFSPFHTEHPYVDGHWSYAKDIVTDIGVSLHDTDALHRETDPYHSIDVPGNISSIRPSKFCLSVSNLGCAETLPHSTNIQFNPFPYKSRITTNIVSQKLDLKSTTASISFRLRRSTFFHSRNLSCSALL